MVSSRGEPITIKIRFQKSIDGFATDSSDDIFIKGRPLTTAAKIKTSITQSRFAGDPIFLEADNQLVQDNATLSSFKDCDLYAGLA